MTETLPDEPKSTGSANSAEIIDQLQNLPRDERDDLIATMEMYSGPIPHPDILKGYQNLYPDAAKRIIENGLQESEHRRNLETKRQRRRGHLAYICLWGGLAITVLFLLLSFYLILHGHQIIGSVFAGTSFLALLGTVFDLIPKLTGNDDLHSNDD